MKILYITNQVCGPAGLERVLSIKTRYLIEEYGYDIHILTLNQGDTPLFYDFHPDIIYHDIAAIGNPITYFSAYRKGLRNVVEMCQPDIISVCDDGIKGFFVPKWVSKPCPMIYERHVSQNVEQTTDGQSFVSKFSFTLKKKVMHWGARQYDAFVVLTEDNTAEWDLENIKVISNPLSFYPEDSSNLDRKVVLAVGRQSFQKGYDRMLQSWKIVQDSHPDWQLHIYGKIDPELQLDAEAKRLGVETSVSFYPPVKNIQDKYQEASIYVMPSRFEGFGMVLIEAMSCGVPVISYDCPCGPADIITENEDGFLIPNGDIAAFAKAIDQLITDQSLRQSMGQKAKKNSKRYLPKHIVPQWHRLFQELYAERQK